MSSSHQHAVLHAYPLINARYQYGGMRIVIDNHEVDEAELRDTLTLVSEANADATHPLIVAFAGDLLPFSLEAWQPPQNTIPEFHGEWLSLPAARDLLSGNRYPSWCLNGMPGEALGPAMLGSLGYTIAHGVPGARPQRSPMEALAAVRTGLNSKIEADASFARGAKLVAGWPLQAVTATENFHHNDNRAVVARLLQLARDDADISELDALLKQDAGLAFKLLRTINSAATGMSMQVQSLQHAVMILGYNRLIRWLAVLLLVSGEDRSQLPLMNISLRRGYFMERVGRLLFNGINPDEPFMTGLFSLLHLIFGRPLDELLESLYLPETVSDALRNHGEPYGPLLRLAEAIEGDNAADIRACTKSLGLNSIDVNRALLLAIRDTDKVDLC